MRTKVVMNRWTGQGFESNAACDICERQGNLISFKNRVFVCSTCLYDALNLISNAVLKECGIGPNNQYG